MAYLETVKTAVPQFRSPRRETLIPVVVIHSAENTPDWVAFDGGAESVAHWCAVRTTYGSYHIIVDSDSRINLVDFDNEAFHVAVDGFNRRTIGLSVATRADVWALAPAEWTKNVITNLAKAAADAARHIEMRTGKKVLARRINRDQALAAEAGFVSHGDLDPGRRHDPGSDFDWPKFLDEFDEYYNNPQEEMFDVAQFDQIMGELRAVKLTQQAILQEIDQAQKISGSGVGWVKADLADRHGKEALTSSESQLRKDAIAFDPYN